MCGILGIVSMDNRPLSIQENKLVELTNLMKHRGPDASGILMRESFCFGHTRLSIIDLSSKASQPMSDEQGEVFITYNGEIYNYMDIRNELIAKGHLFRSNSDTEVVIEAYKQWGISCVCRFNGMFAFGLFDTKKRKLFLVRDRLGIKPLYYSFHENMFLFASELKSIINFPSFVRKPNRRALSCFLSYRQVLGKETLFENVFQLEPGYMLECDSFGCAQKNYWDIDLNAMPFPLDKAGKLELKSLIGDAVNKTLGGDVEVGTLLSGGLDSSIILSIISAESRKRKSFTVRFEEGEFDESYYSGLVARRFNSKNYVVSISAEDYMNSFQEYVAVKDQPVGMHNEIAAYLLAREIKKTLSVVLSGEGADELFSGYGKLFRSPLDYQKIKFVEKMPIGIRAFLRSLLGVKDGTTQLTELEHFLNSYTYFPQSDKERIYNSRMKKAVNHDQYYHEIFAHAFQKCSNRNYYDKISYVFVKHHLPGLLLMMDATAMASGVEVRVPFLDHRLVEKSFQIPYYQKLPWRSPFHKMVSGFYSAQKLSERLDSPKGILKELYRRDLPGEVICRRKMGFPAPLNQWFKEDFKRIVEKVLFDQDAMIHEFFEPKHLYTWMFENEKKGSALLGRQLLMLLNIEYWLRKYF